MSSINLGEMSLLQLKELEKELPKAIKRAEAQERSAAVQAVQKAAAEFGFSLDELTSDKPRKKVRKAKYAHPENPEITWSGFGRQPAWYKELIEAGTKPSTLLIK